MSSHQLIQLVDLLMQRTASAAAKWEEFPGGDTYITQIGNNSVSIKMHREDVAISIYNENGSVVESFTDVTLSNMGTEGAYPKMKELFEMARRNALGADRVLNDILRRLSE